jgi:hypothetical protein
MSVTAKAVAAVVSHKAAPPATAEATPTVFFTMFLLI